MMQESISIYLGVVQLMNELGWGDDVVHTETASRIAACTIQVRVYRFCLEASLKEACKKLKHTILNAWIARIHGFP